MHFVRIWTQLNVWAFGAQLRSYEYNYILGYCAMWSHVSKPTFLRCLLPASWPFIRGYYVDGSCCCWEASNGYIILIWMTLGKLSFWRQRKKWNVGEVGCEDGTWRGLSRGCLISGVLWLIDWLVERVSEWSCQWGETTSLNRGDQRGYSSSGVTWACWDDDNSRGKPIRQIIWDWHYARSRDMLV
jgi:hypothetical protein